MGSCFMVARSSVLISSIPLAVHSIKFIKFIICRFGLQFEHSVVCVGPCQCIRIGRMDQNRKCNPLSIDEYHHAGFRGESSVVKDPTQGTKVFLLESKALLFGCLL